MARWLKIAFFAAVVRPVLLLVIGTRIRHRDRLPDAGPAIVAANHNSHLDTLALMAMFPLPVLHRVRPVAAEDYFGGPGAFGWFARNVIGIVPVARGGGGEANPLAGAEAALAAGDIVILFPEGSRGEPERPDRFRKGIAHLARACPAAPVVPVFLHGFGKTLPRGSRLLVPFNCDVIVGWPMHSDGSIDGFVAALDAAVRSLAAEHAGAPPPERPGEVVMGALPPGEADAVVRYIGRIRSNWGPGDCPKNLRTARESGGGRARVDLDPVYAPALRGLAEGQAVIVVYWMDRARRDLLVQSPAHVAGPRGTFSIRSPARPNPVTLATVRITRIDGATLWIDAIDAYDDTPVIDLKPWSEGIDVPPPAEPG